MQFNLPLHHPMQPINLHKIPHCHMDPNQTLYKHMALQQKLHLNLKFQLLIPVKLLQIQMVL